MDLGAHILGTCTYAMVPTHTRKPRTGPCAAAPTLTHSHQGPSPQPWPCPPTCPLLGGPPPLHITNRGPGAVTQQYGGGAIPGGERPEGPGEAYGQ